MVRFFNPKGVPLFDNNESKNHPKLKELRELLVWSEGQVWFHGNMSGGDEDTNRLDSTFRRSCASTQGKALAVMQVTGGSQNFNAVNNLRVLGRWMRMLTIPNQSSVAKAYNEFEENGQMKDSAYRDRIVDVMEELMRFTYLTRDDKSFLVDRYSERKNS